MKVLFCHDGPIEKDNSGNYYSIGFNDELFERYDFLNSQITIAIRVNNNSKLNTDSNYQLLTKEKYHIVECPNLSSIKGIVLNRKKCKDILGEQIKKSDFIIIRLPSNIGNLAASIAEKYKKKYVIELVGCPWDALKNHSIKGRIIAPFVYESTKKHVKKAENVIYVTETFLQNRYPNYKRNMGCSDVIIEESGIEYLNKRLNRINNMEEKIVLGTIGQIDIKYKGQEYVIKAIKKLLSEGFSDIEYQLVGPGNKKRLSKIANKNKVYDKIKFIGPLKHKEIFKWIENIDIYIQPSTTEGMPRSLIEAMSKGCPAIVSDVGGMPELLDKEMIFKNKNYKEICNLIIKLSNKDMMIKQANNNYNSALNFKKNILEEKRKKFYNEIIITKE